MRTTEHEVYVKGEYKERIMAKQNKFQDQVIEEFERMK